MPFYIGDDNGSIKRVLVSRSEEGVKIVSEDDLVLGVKGKQKAIQCIDYNISEKMASNSIIRKNCELISKRKASSLSC